MKKLGLLTMIVCLCMTLVGCRSNIDNKHEVNYIEIETANIENDESLLLKAKSIYDENLKKCQSNSEKQVVHVKYLDDVYQIASNRVNLDLDILSVFSEQYETYIATMQAYSEVYLKERKELVANTNLVDMNHVEKTKSGKMLSLIQSSIEEQK